MYGVRVVMVVSAVFFACGLSDYLYSLDPTVGWHSWSCVVASAAVYLALTVFPLIIGNCPYETALTHPLRLCLAPLLFFGRTLWLRLRRQRMALSFLDACNFDKDHFLVKAADGSADDLDIDAMKWLFTDNDLSDTDMDRFLEGLPGFVRSQITAQEALPKVLTAPYIRRRIREHLLTCVTATEPSEEARIKRVLACVESLRIILPPHTNAKGLTSKDEEPLQEYIRSIVVDLNTLCGKPGEKSDLRAFCVRALAFQGFLTKCIDRSPDPAREDTPDVKVPDHFIPLLTFFLSFLPHQHTVSPAAVSEEFSGEVPRPDEDSMRRTLLNDGLFINLTLLAEAIYSHKGDVDPSTIFMCWKTLDLLRREFRINRTDVSGPSLKLFDDIHEETRSRVKADKQGIGLGPLLETLDAVDGGRRLSMVFQADDEYHPKADLVFGKDRLRNPDLFRAFADRLPNFLTDHPEKSVQSMEGFVLRDHLWTSLQVHLSDSLRPNISIPTILHNFETCCVVIDAAFVALENSQEVDLRAPDFGSLAHYFELFVTDCFRGIFIERAIAFRVGLIKARFCRTTLAQFLHEFSIEGTVIFRSHWDVASLARVFYSLGVGNIADVEFWKLFVDGGPVDPAFIAKTHMTLRLAERDGPLLNFCKLGHLGMMAVPFKGSGLKDTDFQNLLGLMQKMMEDSHLPLTNASPPVWDELRQLREDVFTTREGIGNDQGIVESITEEDTANMNKLLEKISKVYSQRPSSTQEYRVRTQASGTSAIVQPNLTSGESMPGINRSGYASSSSTVVEDWHDNSPAQVDDPGGTAFLCDGIYV
jgi:hypothetical protein